MSIRNILKKAEALFHQGEFEQSIEICLAILEKKPRLFGARQRLAYNYQSIGKFTYALEEFEKASLIKPKSATTFSNIGNIYVELGQYDLAEKQYQKALKLEHLFPEAWNNLATCQLRIGNEVDAEANYRKAIMYGGSNADFHMNLAQMLIKQGLFNKALKVLFTSLELDHHSSKVYRSVLTIYMYQQRYQDALEAADLGLQSNNLSDGELCELLVNKAILFWLFDNPVEAEQAILLSESIYQHQQQTNSVALSNLCTFHSYIKQLLVLKKQKIVEKREDDLESLYFISESHGFAPNDGIVDYEGITYQIRSLFLHGTKVLHLIQDKNNSHQQGLLSILEGLPEKSKVVMAVGEIDCRTNEGIFVYCLKNKLDYKHVIDDMLSQYIAMLNQQAKLYDIEILLYGVPAPNQLQVDLLCDMEQQELFKQVINYFNKKLKSLCDDSQFAFLDVYQLTEQNLVSNLDYHLDTYHVGFDTVPQLFKSLSKA